MKYEDNWKPEVHPTGLSLYSQRSKLKTTDIGQPFVACPSLQAPIQEPSPFNGAKVPLEAYIGSKKGCHRNQTRDFGARHTVEYDSVLSQQFISGKAVSLIVCVRKPGFFKSSHMWWMDPIDTKQQKCETLIICNWPTYNCLIGLIIL